MANCTSENSAPFFFLPHVTSEPCSFAELYICVSNYFFSSPYNKRLHAFLLPRLRQQEECPPKYSLSCLWHAHLSARQHSNFLDIFGFNERDLGATNAVGAVMTHFNSIVQIESLRLSLIFIIPCFLVQTTVKRQTIALQNKSYHTDSIVIKVCYIEILVQNNGHYCTSSNVGIVCII